MIGIEGMAHVGLRIRNFDRSIGFYQALGFQVIREDYNERVVVLRHHSGIEINLLDSADAGADENNNNRNVLMDESRKYPGYTHVALQVEDIQQAQQSIMALRIVITEGPVTFGDGSTSIFFRDPDRNVIELSQPARPLRVSPGCDDSDSAVNGRTMTYPIEPLFLQRWSPRAYIAQSMPDTDLKTILEAARWAPSAYNIQPWRFVYSHRNDAYWQDSLQLLDPFNRSWARHASALVFVLSNTRIINPDDQLPRISRTHSFDTGSAWAQLALQATALGYQAHAMAGIEYALIPRALRVPDHYQVEIAVAIGRVADADVLPEILREREKPSERLPLAEIAFPGTFNGEGDA